MLEWEERQQRKKAANKSEEGAKRHRISKGRGEPEIHKNSFSLQIYNAKDLKLMLERNGFEIVCQCDMDGNNFLAEKSLNILTVAKRKSG